MLGEMKCSIQQEIMNLSHFHKLLLARHYLCQEPRLLEFRKDKRKYAHNLYGPLYVTTCYFQFKYNLITHNAQNLYGPLYVYNLLFSI